MNQENNIAISFNNVFQHYRIKFSYPDRTQERDIKALDNINIKINKGESIAILGPNGAGKTSILKIIAGIIKPDAGDVVVNGKVRGIFELGAGFLYELTGYENVKMILKLYDIEDKNTLDKITDFSELGDFIYAPLKTYSQGMYLRLAFSTAIHTDPEILVIDDILAVGDFHFQKKCLSKMEEIIAQNVTLILVTHNFNMAALLCKKCLILERGKIIAQGTPQETQNAFTEISGNIWGIGCIKNASINLIFNNGTLGVKYRDLSITAALGIFVTFIKNNSMIYHSDFSWEVIEGSDTIKAIGCQGKTKACFITISLSEDCVEFSIVSKIPQTEFNFMFSENYSIFQAKSEYAKLPPIMQETLQDWHKEKEIISNHISLIPQDIINYPAIALLSYTKNSKIELFNYYYEIPARILKVSTTEANLNLRMLLSDKIKADTTGIKNGFFLAEFINKINNLLIEKKRIPIPLLRKINFLRHGEVEPFTDFECEILSDDFSSSYKMLIHFLNNSFSVYFTFIITDSRIVFNFSALSPDAPRLLKGIGLILLPEFCYKYYSTNFLEGAIEEDAAILKSQYIKLISAEQEYKDIEILTNKQSTIEINKDIYNPENINIKFFNNIDKTDFSIEVLL